MVLLQIWQSSGWFYMRFQFFIEASLIVDTKGWYVSWKRHHFFFLLVVLFQKGGLPFCGAVYTWCTGTSAWVSAHSVVFTLWVPYTVSTSFPGFSPTRPTERVGENPGNEVDLKAIDYTFWWFPGVISHVGCWETIEKLVSHSPSAPDLQAFLAFSQHPA